MGRRQSFSGFVRYGPLSPGLSFNQALQLTFAALEIGAPAGRMLVFHLCSSWGAWISGKNLDQINGGSRAVSTEGQRQEPEIYLHGIDNVRLLSEVGLGASQPLSLSWRFWLWWLGRQWMENLSPHLSAWILPLLLADVFLRLDSLCRVGHVHSGAERFVAGQHTFFIVMAAAEAWDPCVCGFEVQRGLQGWGGGWGS